MLRKNVEGAGPTSWEAKFGDRLPLRGQAVPLAHRAHSAVPFRDLLGLELSGLGAEGQSKR